MQEPGETPTPTSSSRSGDVAAIGLGVAEFPLNAASVHERSGAAALRGLLRARCPNSSPRARRSSADCDATLSVDTRDVTTAALATQFWRSGIRCRCLAVSSSLGWFAAPCAGICSPQASMHWTGLWPSLLSALPFLRALHSFSFIRIGLRLLLVSLLRERTTPGKCRNHHARHQSGFQRSLLIHVSRHVREPQPTCPSVPLLSDPAGELGSRSKQPLEQFIDLVLELTLAARLHRKPSRLDAVIW